MIDLNHVTTPSYFFSRSVVQENAQFLRGLAKKNGIVVLYAKKVCPIEKLNGDILSFSHGALTAQRVDGLQYQLLEAKDVLVTPERKFSLLRLDCSLFFYKTSSRFGERGSKQASGLAASAQGIRVYLPAKISFIRLLQGIERMGAFAQRLPSIKAVSFGCLFHEYTHSQLQEVFSALRKSFPGVFLAVEPGRFFFQNAGFAVGRVKAQKKDIFTLDLSLNCHLRFSQPKLIHGLPNSRSKNVFFDSISPLEGDVLRFRVPESVSFDIDEPVLFGNIMPISLYWNRSFALLKRAKLRLL